MTDEKSITEVPQDNNVAIDGLRLIPGFANFCDDQLLEVTESIKEFALLLNTIPPVEQIKNGL